MAKKSNEVKIEPGLKYRGWDRDPWYVVLLFEDKGAEYVVVRSWAKYRRRWTYQVLIKEVLEDWLGRERD